MDGLLVVARFAHYAAAIQLFGVAAFYWLLTPPGLKPAMRSPSRWIAVVSAALMLLSAVAWLAAVAASMGDDPSAAFDLHVVGTVLVDTEFGRVWGPRIGLCVFALVAACLSPAWAWRLNTLLSAAALGSLGYTGHAVSETGLKGSLNETSQLLHLLSSGFWLGALLPLLFCLALFRDPRLAPHADRALRRFSGLGHIAVALLIATGVANTWFVLGARLDLTSAYGRLLLIKIAIAAMMCLLAILNRYVFMPRISNNGPGAPELARGTLAEIVLGVAILGLVAVIGTLSPR